MKIVKVIPESFLEYEDHLSIVLFVFGCNARCSYCYNYEIVTNRDNILKQTPLELVRQHVTPMHTGLVILGGEPTIYNLELILFGKEVKHMFDLKVKVFTNGLISSCILEGLLSGAFDLVSIDVKTFDPNIQPMTAAGYTSKSYIYHIKKLLDKIAHLNLSTRVEARTTMADGITESHIEEIRKYCSDRGIKHIVQYDVRSQIPASVIQN